MARVMAATTRLGGLFGLRAFSTVGGATATVAAGEGPGSSLWFTAEEKQLRDVAKEFAQTVLSRHSSIMDKAGYMNKEVLDGMFARGLLGVEIEKKYGGTGQSFTASCLVVEEIAKVDPAVAVLCDIQNTLNNTLIRRLGTPAQKEKYLPRLCKDMVSSFCLSESGAGSDAFALKTKALKKDGAYVLNGSKLWISNSAEAGVFLVMANADPSKGFRGITTFLVDRDSPGLTVDKKENKLGIRASSTCPVIFEDVLVPADHVLGEEGKGYKYAIEMLNEGRIGIAAQMVGLAQGALLYSRPHFTDYALSEANRQAMHQVTGDVEAARLMVYNAARLRETRQAFIMQAAMAKLYSSQVAERTARACVQWCGEEGVMGQCPAEKYYRDSKIGSIYEGTSNIQLSTIAKLLDVAYA